MSEYKNKRYIVDMSKQQAVQNQVLRQCELYLFRRNPIIISNKMSIFAGVLKHDYNDIYV
jgi:hypothetical protein